MTGRVPDGESVANFLKENRTKAAISNQSETAYYKNKGGPFLAGGPDKDKDRSRALSMKTNVESAINFQLNRLYYKNKGGPVKAGWPPRLNLLKILSENIEERGDFGDENTRSYEYPNKQPSIDNHFLKMSPRVFGRGHQVTFLGANNSLIFSTGSIESLVFEAVVPFAHNFAKLHDYWVSNLVNSGVPRAIANIPTMPIAYITASIISIPIIITDLLFGDSQQSSISNWERESVPGGRGGY